MNAPCLIAIMGPSASGKTALAESLAGNLGAQLISADAFQVYVGMDIGTAKPKTKAAYRMLDLRKPNEQFGLGEWISSVHPILDECWAAGRSVVVVGGTGLYIRALFEEYAEMSALPDPEHRAELMNLEAEHGPSFLAEELTRLAPDIAQRTDLRNPLRVRRALEKLRTPASTLHFSLPPFCRIKLGLNPSVERLNTHIHGRLIWMIKDGWEAEVRSLIEQGYGKDDPGMKAIGYREMLELINGTANIQDTLTSIETATRRYCKRQRTWLRSEPMLRMLEWCDSPESLLSQAEGLIRGVGGEEGHGKVT